MIFEDYTYIRQQIDLGVIITQEETAIYQSKNFILKETKESSLPFFDYKIKIPRYDVKSLFTNTIYRDCIACSDIGLAGYKVGDVVLVVSIRDEMFFILTKVNWLYQKRFEEGYLEPAMPNRKVLTNEVSSISIEPSGEINFRFGFGYYDNLIKFGGFSVDKMGRALLLIANDTLGEFFRMDFDGSVVLKSMDSIELLSKVYRFNGEKMVVNIEAEGDSLSYSISEVATFRVKSLKNLEETYFRLMPSVLEFYLGNKKQCRFYYQAKDGRSGSILFDFNEGLKVEMDGDIQLVKIYEDEGNLEWVAKAETLRSELNELRSWLESHIHIDSRGKKTTPPIQPLPPAKDFFSKKVKVE